MMPLGVSGLFFIAVNSPRIDVVEFARQIFTDPEFPDQVKSWYGDLSLAYIMPNSYLCHTFPTSNACHRLIPIQRVCAANESDIASIAEVLIPSSFPDAENMQKVRSDVCVASIHRSSQSAHPVRCDNG